MEVTSTKETVERVKIILRRTLNLSASTAIDDDLPFSELNADLDSLDMLLLVTNVEKEFGIKIPNEAMARDAFTSVATLARFIAGLAGSQSADAKPAAAAAALAEYLAKLPHADPFRFISRITTLTPGETGTAVWAVSGKEAFFAGHFPGNPVVPGVLLAEALAQLCGLVGAARALGDGQNVAGRLAKVEVRFPQSAAPPADIILTARFTRAMGALYLFEATASVADKVVAQGSLTLACVPGNAPCDMGKQSA